MTKEELKEHCKRQVECCEMWARNNGGEPHGKVYEEHKLILDLINTLEQSGEDCVSRAEVLKMIEAIQDAGGFIGYNTYSEALYQVNNMPPVTPTHGTCKECKYSSVHTISLDKIGEIRVCRIQFSKQIKDDYYCADYEKRGNENEIN